MKWILWLIVAVTICSGCKTTSKVQTEYFTEIIEVHDTIRDLHVEILRDSIYLHDSIIVTKDVEGKVIYKEKYVYRDLWHDAETVTVHDSIIVYKDHKDSETDNQETITETPWYKPLAIFGAVALLAICLLFVLKRWL